MTERPLICEFSPVTDFRESRCRQFDQGECTRGGYCNFMHMYKIPEEVERRIFGQLFSRRSPSPQRGRGGPRRDNYRDGPRDGPRDDYRSSHRDGPSRGSDYPPYNRSSSSRSHDRNDSAYENRDRPREHRSHREYEPRDSRSRYERSPDRPRSSRDRSPRERERSPLPHH